MQVTEFKKYAKEDDGSKDIVDFTEFPTDNQKLQSALAFLQYIDPSCYLCNVADPTKPSPLLDDTLRERNERIERMTSAMDVQQYLEYTKVFQSNQVAGLNQNHLTFVFRQNVPHLRGTNQVVNFKTGCLKIFPLSM